MIRVFFVGVVLLSTVAFADELENFSKTCTEIGFKAKTEAHGDCVLELRRRDAKEKQSTERTASQPPRSATAKRNGDGTPDDTTCQRYGFDVGSEPYGQCRLQLRLAAENAQRQQQIYEQQQRAYEHQLAAYEEEKKRQEKAKAMKQLELGIRLMAGQAPLDAALATEGKLPIAPQRPAFENYTITMPGGRTTPCTYNTVARIMNCF